MKNKTKLNQGWRYLSLVIVFLTFAIKSFAYDFLVDGIYYKITNSMTNEVSVTLKLYSPGGGYSSATIISDYVGNVVIPSSVVYNGKTYLVTGIDNHAFDDSDVTSVFIPNTVKSIGNSAFAYCALLKDIQIPSSVTTFGSSVFTGSGLTNPVTCGNTLLYCPPSYEGEYHIPMGITVISGSVFSGCSKITKVIIPHGVKKIDSYTFHYCDALESVCIPSTVEYISVSAFSGCSSLKECVLPPSVYRIEKSAFVNCKSLETFVIPTGMRSSIEDDTFSGCSSLKSVVFPAGVTNILLWAFYGTPQGVEIYNFASCRPGQSEGPTGLYPSNIHVPAGWTNSGVYSPISGTLVYDLESISSISINKTNLTLTDGGSTTLSCSITPSNASVKTLHWSSSNTDVAIVDNNGKVTALSRGTATITAKTLDGSNLSASCSVTVKTLTYDIDEASTTSFVNTETSDYNQITYTRNFKNTGWQELYVPFAMSYEDWKNDFEVGYIEGFLSRDLDNNGTIDETIWSGVKITDGTLLPNTPYIIRAKTTGNKTITLRNATLYATEENFIDCSSTTMRYIFKGVYESESYASAEYYPYYLNNGMFNRVPRIVPFRWTLRFESRGNSFVIHPNLTRGFVRENDGSPFDEYVENNPDLFAVYKVFTLDGRMIDMTTETLKPGFYIKNGKKVLVK